MRILITTGIFPPDIGGPATQLDALIKEILVREPSFKITVLTFGEKSGNYPYEVIKISKKSSKIFRSFFYFAKTFILSFQNDTIYAWDLYTAGVSSYLAKKIMPRKKLIIRFVGDMAWENYINQKSKIKNQNENAKIKNLNNFNFDNIENFINNKYGFFIESRKWLRKKMLMSAGTVVVPSEFMKRVAVKIGVDENKIKVIYNSVDFLFDEKEIRELQKIDKNFCKKELGLKDGAIYLMSASRLAPWKGQSALIEIMPDLIKKYRDIFLFIIGEGPEFNNLKSQISNLKLEENVFLTGKLSHKEVFKHFKCADIFLLNTFYEGMSHTLLEAMTLGIPIVTTFAGGNPELIEDGRNGFLIEFNNKREIINAVEKIIENPKLKSRFAEDSKEKLKKFNFDDMVRETIEVLKETV